MKTYLAYDALSGKLIAEVRASSRREVLDVATQHWMELVGEIREKNPEDERATVKQSALY